jgi:hypothetical protein
MQAIWMGNTHTGILLTITYTYLSPGMIITIGVDQWDNINIKSVQDGLDIFVTIVVVFNKLEREPAFG